MTQICIDHYQVILSFYRPPQEVGPDKTSGSLGIEGAWELRGPTGAMVDQRQAVEPDREVYRIHRLLARVVKSWRLLPPSAFELEFADGHVLRVIEDEPAYEFCSVNLPGGVNWYL